MQTVQRPPLHTLAGFRRFTVNEYHRMIEIGLLTENDRLELLDGFLVEKMSQNPRHSGKIARTMDILRPLIPSVWMDRQQVPLILSGSVPEPDIAIVRRDANYYETRHPTASDVGMLIEISDSSLAGDRQDKCPIYARAGIRTYWIINVIDRQLEVYTAPSGPAEEPSFAERRDYHPGERVPVVLDGVEVGTVAVADLFAGWQSSN